MVEETERITPTGSCQAAASGSQQDWEIKSLYFDTSKGI
jgi:hypothetical protein